MEAEINSLCEDSIQILGASDVICFALGLPGLCVWSILCGVTDLLFMPSCPDLEFGSGRNKTHALKFLVEEGIYLIGSYFLLSAEVWTLMTGIPDPAF